MIVSVRLLKKYGACEEQVKLFAETFGKGAKVTVTAALCREHASKFDWDWAAQSLLSEAMLAEYDAKWVTVWAEYDAKCATLWAEYDAKCAELLEEYDAKCAELLEEYNAKRAELFGTIAERM